MTSALAGGSSLERTWATRWAQLAPTGTAAYVVEYRFHPTRKWRFDVCWPAVKVAVELEGGTNTGGRHVRPAGYEQDVEKYNQAVVLGWRLLRFTSQQLDDDPLGCVALVVAVLAQPPASAILTIT